jgi:hemolysin activation/secretion protein
VQIRVSRFVFTGNTVIDTETLEALAAPYLDRSIAT